MGSAGGGLARRGGRPAPPSPEAVQGCVAGRGRALGDLGGLQESLPLTMPCCRLTANARVHQAVLPLPVQTLRHWALASIRPDI